MYEFNTQTQMLLLDAASATANFATNWLIQSTLLIVAGLIVARLFRSRGSAVQSVVYRTTLVAALICPLATFALASAGFSGWSVNLPAAWIAASGPVEPPIDVAILQPLSEAAAESFATKSAENWQNNFTASENEFPSDTETASNMPATDPASLATDNSMATVDSSTTAIVPVPFPVPVSQPDNAVAISIRPAGIVAMLAATIWIVIALLLLTRLISAWRKLWQLKRSATAAEPELASVCEQLSIRMDVTPPRVYRSPLLPSPCLAGLRSPSILLPEDDCGLALQDVLIHELAHLRRHDCHWNLLRRIATSILFFQPLLWRLSSRIEASAEEVCDDFVVQFGGDRVQYATRLVDIAELSTAPIAAAGVGVVSLRSMLSHRVTRIMDTSRTLSTRTSNLILVCVLSCGLVGTGAAGLLGLSSSDSQDEFVALDSDEEEIQSALTQATASKQIKTSSDESAELIIKGTVVAEDNRPIRGAIVDLLGRPNDANVAAGPQLGSVTSNKNGQFLLTVDKAKFPDVSRSTWKEATVFAHKKGFGPDWILRADMQLGEDVKLVLAADEVPVNTRLVDLEGNPLAGVTARLEIINAAENKNLDQWLAALKRGQVFWEANNEHLSKRVFFPTGFSSDLKTDSDGNLKIAGIGKDRFVSVILQGPTIAYTRLLVATRDMEPVVMSEPKMTVYGANSTIAVAPSQAVTGIVKDAKTGQPMAGVAIESYYMPAQHNMVAQREIRVTTDENGRYTLTGLPKGISNEIIAVPNDDQPYLMRVFEVPNPTGMQPIELDLELNRGVWITGSLKDKATGQNLEIKDEAYVSYYPYLSNPFALATPEYHEGEFEGYQLRYKVAANGSYRLVGLPGKAIVGATVAYQGYPQGQGAENIAGADEDGRFPTYRVGSAPSGTTPTVLREVDIAETAESFEVDLQLESGKTIAVAMTDPAGNAINGVSVTGLDRFSGLKTISKNTFDAVSFKPGDQRTILFHHAERKLGKVVRVTADDEKNQKLAVQLQPCVTIRGRLIDKDNEPISGATVGAGPLPGGDFHPELKKVWTDADGRFEHTEVLPGADYNVVSESIEMRVLVAKNLTVNPGETIDLGTINVSEEERPKPVRTKSAELKDAKDKAVSNDTISGFVVGADRKPVAGAEIYSIISRAREHDSLPPKLVATSDENGRYSFRQPKLDLPEDAPARWEYRSSLVIKAPGHGFVTDRPESLLRQMEEASSPQEWIARTLAGVSGAIIVLPPAGNPIQGRILDIDGQPVANARISIQWFAGLGSSFTIQSAGKLNGRFVYDNAEQWKGAIDSLVQTIEPQRAIDAFPTATTDADGRFELKDIGDNRLFTLVIQGDGIETKKVYAYNQPGKQVNAKSDDNGRRADKYSVYPQEFTHIAGPSNPIIGKVVDYDSDKPIANALVIATSLHGTNKHLDDAKGLFTVKTDDAGNFRMAGLPVGSRNQLVCFCNKSEVPYPLLGFGVDTSSGPIERKFRMKRGLWAEGRVFDSKTKKPWTGHIDYSYMRNSELERTYPGVRFAYLQFAYWTNNDGRFRVPVWPTRGLLSYFYQPRNHEEAQERPIDDYPRGSFVSAIEGYGKEPGSWATFPLAVIPSTYWMTKEINPEGSADSIKADLPLVASRSLIVKTTWPEGSGIKNYRIFNSNGNKFWHRTDSLEVEVKGLKQGERRELFAFHRGQNLIGKATVDASMPEGTVVEIKDIQKAGFIIGRLVDEDGEPITNAIINALETRWAFHPGKMSNPSRIPTDENGNFRITGIVPGNRYGASVSVPRKYMDSMMDMHIGYAFDGVTVEPGETKDLGDLRPRAKEEIEQDSDSSASTKGEAK